MRQLKIYFLSRRWNALEYLRKLYYYYSQQKKNTLLQNKRVYADADNTVAVGIGF